MAQAVGAAVTDLNRFYGHLLCRDAMENDRVWPYPELDALASAGILVGSDARRFADEGRGGIFLANAIAGLDDPLSATVVFDSAIWNGPGRSARIPANPQLARAGGTVHQADTIIALASAAALSTNELTATVASYNQALGAKAIAGLKPPRTSGAYQAYPIATPPFFAIPICAGITYTMGGIRIDANARVLRDDGTAIEGLYAAGSTAGGIEGGDNAAYVGGLIKAGVFGLRAAEHAASRRSARQ
jgi:fumarate reductase flavoprotein subunit